MKTIIILLFNRQCLEWIEGSVFRNETEMIQALKDNGMTEEQEENLGYYDITDFMDLVNDQVIDGLTDTFFGYVKIKE